MRVLKAKNPVNAGQLGPDMPLIKNTIHKKFYMESLQQDGSQSKMMVTINEDFLGVLWMGVTVDGKSHGYEFPLKELVDAVTELSE